MRNTSMLAVVAMSLAAGSALAFEDGERVHVGSFALGASEEFSWTYLNIPNNDMIFAVTFEIDYGEPVGDASYASDLQVWMTTPTGVLYIIGGYDFPGMPWAFQGGVSNPPGVYVDKIFLNNWEPKGWWTFMFLNDWAADPNPNTYDIWVTFQKIPSPGALALLGMGGFAVARRRR